MIQISLSRRPYISWVHHPASSAAIGGIALTISILAASTFNAFAKQLSFALSPFSLIFISELLTIFFILLTFGLFPTLHSIRKLKRKHMIMLALIGVLTGVVGPYLFFLGLSMTSAVNASFFSQTESIFVMIYAFLLLKQKVTSTQLYAAASILCGVLIISLHGFTAGFDIRFGDIILVSAVACFTLGYVLIRKHLSHVEPHLPLFARSMTAMSVFFLTSPFVNHPFMDEVRGMNIELAPVLIGFAFVSRFLNSITFYQAVDRLNIVTISLTNSLTIITSLCFTWLYLGEPLVWYHFFGGSFIILGNILVELTSLKRHSERELAHSLKQRVHR